MWHLVLRLILFIVLAALMSTITVHLPVLVFSSIPAFFACACVPVLFSTFLSYNICCENTESEEWTAFVGAVAGLCATVIWPTGRLILMSYLPHGGAISLNLAIPCLIGAPILGAVLTTTYLRLSNLNGSRENTSVTKMPTCDKKSLRNKQQCPWCEELVTPNADDRCPACDRPI